METGIKHLLITIAIIAIIAIVIVFTNGFISNSTNDIGTNPSGWASIAVPGTQSHVYAPDNWQQNITNNVGDDNSWVIISSPDNNTEVVAINVNWDVPYGDDITKQIASQGYIDDGVYNTVIGELEFGDDAITNITTDENNYKLNGMPAREFKGVNDEGDLFDAYMVQNNDRQIMFIAMRSTSGNDTYSATGEEILKSIR